MNSASLTQQNHLGSGLRAVSRGALAAGDLERRQQKRSPKRASGGDGVVEGGPGARLLGSRGRLDTFGTVAPLNVSTILSARPEEDAGDAQPVSHAAEAVVSPWMKRCHQRLWFPWTWGCRSVRSDEQGNRSSLRPGIEFQRSIRTVGVVWGRMEW